MCSPQVETAWHETGPPDHKESFIEHHVRAPYLNGILNGKHLPALCGSFLHHADFNSCFTPRQGRVLGSATPEWPQPGCGRPT
jgi:hypothetical protein